MKHWILSAALAFSTASHALEQKIKLRDNGSGEFVRVSYSFPEKLKSGDTFSIFIGDELAARFKPEGNFYTKTLETSVRLMSTNTIKGILKTPHSAPVSVEERAVIGREFEMPTECDTDPDIYYKKAFRKDSIKIKFKHPMSRRCYMNEIEISSDIGKLTITSTSHLSINPVFIFEGTPELSEPSVRTAIKF